MPDEAPLADNTLYLIDGHAQIFRAYYAIRTPMTSPITGEPTGATFAFTAMMLKLFDQFRPHYVVMAIDMPGKTFRDDLYPDYKANREQPPDDFALQIPRIFEITRQFGVPVIGIEGVEADDVIATITQQTLDEPDHDDLQIRIVSKDKDLEQLLGPRVCLFDIHNDTLIDVAHLRRQRGIGPGQVVDLLTLTGDNVDNVPGVEGIGPKTAAKLLQEFGTVETVFEHIDQIKGKRRQRLEEARPHLSLSRRLVTLKRDVPLEFTLDAARTGGVDATALQRLFKELGFNRHQSELERLLSPAEADNIDSDAGAFGATLFDTGASQSSPKSAITSQADYRAITTEPDLNELIRTLRVQPLIAVDTETIGLGPRAILCGICFSWEQASGVYVPMRSPRPQKHLDPETVLTALRPLLEDASLAKCGHNLKYDLMVLRHAGVQMRGIVFDSMIGAFLAGAPGQALDSLSMSLLGCEMVPISDLIGPRRDGKGKPLKQKTMDQVPLEQVTPYAAEDANIALQLSDLLRRSLLEQGMMTLAEQVEMPLVEVLAEMERVGIRVDPEELDRQRVVLQKRIDVLRDEIHEAAECPFNVDSPKQLAQILFSRLGLPVVKRTKTGASTDVEVLEKLCDRQDIDDQKLQVPRLVIEYRQLTKLVRTYLVSLRDAICPETQRIHASFHQTGTATGRLSSSGPNLQTIPVRSDIGRQIRRAFIAEDDHVLISADYSQIELRLLAHLSEDDNLIAAFGADQDIHTTVAAQVFAVDPGSVNAEQRGHAKVINFGIIYGVTPYGLARRIDGLDVEGANRLISSYKQRFPGIDTFLGTCVQQAMGLGYVATMMGRRRTIHQVRSQNGQTRALGERLAINTVVQGSAADLIKLAMLNLHRRIDYENLPMKLLLQIHDELVVEVPKGVEEEMAEVVQQEMESAMQLKVPLKVDVRCGHDWYEAK